MTGDLYHIPLSSVSVLRFSLLSFSVILSVCLSLSSLLLASFCLPLHHILLYSPVILSTSLLHHAFSAHLLALHFPFYPRSILPSCSPNPFKTVFTSPPPLCFLSSILPSLPVAPFPLCHPCFKFPSLVIAFRLFLEVLRHAPNRSRPSVSRSDRAVTLAVATGTGTVQCLAMAAQPDSQTDSQLSHCVYKQSDCSFAGTWLRCSRFVVVV